MNVLVIVEIFEYKRVLSMFTKTFKHEFLL